VENYKRATGKMVWCTVGLSITTNDNSHLVKTNEFLIIDFMGSWSF